ncbi:hypothetical protein [Celeribacter arenosi]|uniref:Lipoprotein n=1 Tax=Celeribacter arenosi TaxID=792649 RepID=A0ABP7K9R6_9RHOB
MVNDSKILTVSYGTFSCTLEGFDDPFSTMRSIAEYFRDLAADDRYFGAEPPTPDPQMLHSIAEKEVQRRVEARMEDDGHGVVLRQLDGEQKDDTPAPVTAQAPSAASPAPAVEAPAPAAAKVGTPVAAATTATAAAAIAPEVAPQIAPTLADKLARIRAAVARRSDVDYVEEQQAPSSFAAPAASAQTAFEEADVEDAVESDAVETVVAKPIVSADPVDTPAEREIETDDEMADAHAPDGFNFADHAVAESPDAAEDTDENDTDEASDDILAAISARAMETPVDTAPEQSFEDDEPADAIALTDSVDEAIDLPADPELAADMAEAMGTDKLTDDDAPLRLSARVVKKADVVESGDDTTDVLKRELGDSSLDTDAEDALLRELAQTSVDDSDAPQIAGDVFDDESDETEEAIAADAEYEDENDLESDTPLLLVAQAPQDADTDTPAPTDGEAGGEDGNGRNVFDTSDDDMSRIMAATDREMAKGENTRRRNAIQHLKAAVGAIRAEKTDKAEAKPEDEEADAYRADLARVVRPRRPVDNATSKPRRLAPLMLVSEQRIDSPASAPMGANIAPIRPRRVSTSALARAEEADIDHESDEAAVGGFAEFAEQVGAEGLEEVIEAAAAYSNFVEGLETVTRPQIMRLAGDALPADTPVEERLRSFGQLLRKGKIRKARRGQFMVSEDTRFRPDISAAE